MVAESWGLKSKGSTKQNGLLPVVQLPKKRQKKKGLEAQSAGEELAAISNENSNSFLQ